MSIYPAFNVRHVDFPAVTDNSAQNSNDMPVSNTIFLVTAIVGASEKYGKFGAL